jgi:hypothetical protein
VASGKILKDITELHKGNKDELGSRIMPLVAQKLAGTYKSRSGKGFWLATGITAAGAAGAGAIYLFLSQKKERGEQTTDIKVSW